MIEIIKIFGGSNSIVQIFWGFKKIKNPNMKLKKKSKYSKKNNLNSYSIWYVFKFRNFVA